MPFLCPWCVSLPVPVVRLVFLFTAHVQLICTAVKYCRYIKNDDHQRTTKFHLIERVSWAIFPLSSEEGGEGCYTCKRSGQFEVSYLPTGLRIASHVPLFALRRCTGLGLKQSDVLLLASHILRPPPTHTHTHSNFIGLYVAQSSFIWRHAVCVK